ncbi:MAG TPA: hypothetical protein PK784_01190 [Tenuifilaceae bacterium]|nr:hypothetical protein [Tenuifilaceae bacterium]HOZ13377.1 hypothetical protein [Tenuifilaceae bacterium]
MTLRKIFRGNALNENFSQRENGLNHEKTPRRKRMDKRLENKTEN